MDNPEFAERLPDVALLYVDFPGLVQRWERAPQTTAAVVFRAHDRVAAAIAAHGGSPVPAPLDARAARFATAQAAVAAARAVRRAERAAGELAARVAVASGPAQEVGTVPMPLHVRARVLAEGAGTDEVRLDGPTADELAGAVPEGARLRRAWPRPLPGLGRLARVFVLREAAPRGNADPHAGRRAPDRRPGLVDRPGDGVERGETTTMRCDTLSRSASAGDDDRRSVPSTGVTAVWRATPPAAEACWL